MGAPQNWLISENPKYGPLRSSLPNEDCETGSINVSPEVSRFGVSSTPRAATYPTSKRTPSPNLGSSTGSRSRAVAAAAIELQPLSEALRPPESVSRDRHVR